MHPTVPRPELPRIATAADLEALRADPSRWTPHVAHLVDELGLGGRPLRNLGGGNLVIAVGADHVLKMTPPCFAREVDAESAALDALADRAWPEPLRAPRLLGRGVSATWPWVLLQRLPGTTFAACRARVPQPDRIAIARALGAWLAALHAAPQPSAPAFEGSWSRYVDGEWPAAVARQASWGVPAHVCVEMQALLDRVCPERGSTTLLHADLHDDNVLVEQRGGRYFATGVIDFGDAVQGDPLFDLVTPVALVARGDATAARVLFDEAVGVGALDDDLIVERFMAYSIVHRWNDLTRVRAWAPDALRSLDALTQALLRGDSAAQRGD